MSEQVALKVGQSEYHTGASVGKAGLQVGLLGAVCMTLFGLLSVFMPQILQFIPCGFMLALPVVIGAVAAKMLGSSRTGRRGAGAGALAGLIAALGGAVGLAASPLDPMFRQNMEILCTSIGGCGDWVSAGGIAVASVSSLLLLLIPAIGLSTIAGGVYGAKKGVGTIDVGTDQVASFDENDLVPLEEPEPTTSKLGINWQVLNLGAASLILIVMGLLGAELVVFIYQNGSVPSGGLLLVSALAGFIWLAVMLSVVKWYGNRPFGLWLGVILWPLLFIVLLVGICPTCKWAEKDYVQSDSVFTYSMIPFSGYAQIVAVGSGKIWASDVYDDTVKVIDPEYEEEVGTVQVGTNPIGVAVAEDAVWVASEGNNTVYRIDPDTLTVVASIPVSSSPLLATTGAGSVWVSLPEEDQVVRIDPVQNEIITNISVGDNPRGLAAGERYIWVANTDDGTITSIDPSSNQIKDKIEVGQWPISVIAHGNAIWVTVNGEGSIARIDPIESEVVASIPAGNGPMALAGSKNSIWVTLIEENAVVHIDPQSNQVVGDPIPVGEQPMGIASDDTGVWVANFGEGSLGRIETATATPESQSSAYQIISTYLVSFLSYLGSVARVTAIGILVWGLAFAIGRLIERVTGQHYWVADTIIVIVSLVLALFTFRSISREIAFGIVAGSISALIVLRSMRRSDKESKIGTAPA